MNKIKITNEKERIKVEFDFENIQVAREYFQDEECIADLVEALDYEEEVEDTDKIENDEQAVEALAKSLKEVIETTPRIFFDAFNKAMEDAKGYKGKKGCCTSSK